jgi:hypothetical protein
MNMDALPVFAAAVVRSHVMSLSGLMRCHNAGGKVVDSNPSTNGNVPIGNTTPPRRPVSFVNR